MQVPFLLQMTNLAFWITLWIRALMQPILTVWFISNLQKNNEPWHEYFFIGGGMVRISLFYFTTTIMSANYDFVAENDYSSIASQFFLSGFNAVLLVMTLRKSKVS